MLLFLDIQAILKLMRSLKSREETSSTPYLPRERWKCRLEGVTVLGETAGESNIMSHFDTFYLHNFSNKINSKILFPHNAKHISKPSSLFVELLERGSGSSGLSSSVPSFLRSE